MLLGMVNFWLRMRIEGDAFAAAIDGAELIARSDALCARCRSPAAVLDFVMQPISKRDSFGYTGPGIEH